MHAFKFYRMGGLDQVSLETGADLAALRELDQKLWVALSCPVRGLELDAKTLELLDTDKDGRVRALEILAAIDWCKPRLRDLGALIPSADGLPLEAINDATPEGKALLAAARRIVKDKPTVMCGDVADVSRVFEGTPFNGDGVVTPESASDSSLAEIIADAVKTMGGVQDRGGKQGIDQAKLDAFYAELQAFADWSKNGAGIVALSEGYEAVRAVRVKVDDYFNRCHIAAFNPAKAVPETTDVPLLPLARIEPGAALPLIEHVNPAWSGALQTFHRTTVVPLFGQKKTALTEVEWHELQPRYAPYEAWLAAKKGALVEPLGLARVEAILTSGARERIAELIAHDLAVKPEADAMVDVVRMAHYKRDLHTLLKNFVNFADFYDMNSQAIFQAGTLYLDSRSCDLCVRVDDPGAHSALASLSRMYLAYCDLKRPNGEAMKIAAVFSQGDSDYLMVGRNGVFYDRKGRDWDATIVKIVDNPISIRQAFFMPYKKFLRMIEEQVQKFAAAKEKEADARLAAAAQASTGVATGAAPAPAAPSGAVDVGKMVGIIAALGVGVGAIGTLFGGFVSGFMSLQPWWAKIVAVFGAMLAISGPSMLLAWLKLRQRTLGPVLEANGWAVNGRVKVNMVLGAALTDLGVLPKGSSRSLDDPFEDKKAKARRRLFWTVVVVLAAAAAVAKYYFHLF